MNLDFAKQKIKHSFYFRTQAARHDCHAAYRAAMHYVSYFRTQAARHDCHAAYRATVP